MIKHQPRAAFIPSFFPKHVETLYPIFFESNAIVVKPEPTKAAETALKVNAARRPGR